MTSRYSQHAQKILDLSLDYAKHYQKQRIEPSHLMLAVYDQAEGQLKTLMERYLPHKVDFQKIYEQEVGEGDFKNGGYRNDAYVFRLDSREILYEADKAYIGFSSESIDVKHIFLAILSGDNQVTQLLEQAGVNLEGVRQVLYDCFEDL